MAVFPVPFMNQVVGSQYKLIRKIGAGSFGEIYVAENINTKIKLAVKLESVKSTVPQLIYESKLYNLFNGGISIPKMHWSGTDGDNNVMVMDLMGKSLENLFECCKRKFSLKTVLMLADQMLTSVEFIHNKNFIHRDIKPDNFVMGTGKSANQVFVIDFGLAKKYRDPYTHVHIQYTEGKSLTGTARYASVNALKGCEQSRRDDLESLGFVWLYLLRGTLPWMGLNGADRNRKYSRICHVKSNTSFERLCSGFPEEFVTYFYTVRSLKFTQDPDYSELRQLFRTAFMRLGYVYDYSYDWTADKSISVDPYASKVPISSIRAPTGPTPKSNIRPVTKTKVEVTETRVPAASKVRPSRLTEDKPLTTRFSSIAGPISLRVAPPESNVRPSRLYSAYDKPKTPRETRTKEAKPVAKETKTNKVEPTIRARTRKTGLPEPIPTPIGTRESRLNRNERITPYGATEKTSINPVYLIGSSRTTKTKQKQFV